MSIHIHKELGGPYSQLFDVVQLYCHLRVDLDCSLTLMDVPQLCTWPLWVMCPMQRRRKNQAQHSSQNVVYNTLHLEVGCESFQIMVNLFCLRWWLSYPFVITVQASACYWLELMPINPGPLPSPNTPKKMNCTQLFVCLSTIVLYNLTPSQVAGPGCNTL